MEIGFRVMCLRCEWTSWVMNFAWRGDWRRAIRVLGVKIRSLRAWHQVTKIGAALGIWQFSAAEGAFDSIHGFYHSSEHT